MTSERMQLVYLKNLFELNSNWLWRNMLYSGYIHLCSRQLSLNNKLYKSKIYVYTKEKKHFQFIALYIDR